MNLRHAFLLGGVVSSSVIAGGCSSPQSNGSEAAVVDKARVSGAVLHRERIALPPEAVLTVRLEDVSRADAPAALIGEQVVRLEGKQAPVPFEIPYDPSKVEEAHRYAVRARIDVDGKPMFTSAQAYSVLTQGSPKTVQVLLERTGRSGAEPDSPLLGTRWKLTELNGAPVRAGPEGREPHVILQEDGRFSGAGGVNLVLGAYKVEGENLTLGPGPSTRMAGPPEAMAQEGAFIDAMKQVRSYRLSGSSLTLGDAKGPVLRFEAAAPR